MQTPTKKRKDQPESVKEDEEVSQPNPKRLKKTTTRVTTEQRSNANIKPPVYPGYDDEEAEASDRGPPTTNIIKIDLAYLEATLTDPLQTYDTFFDLPLFALCSSDLIKSAERHGIFKDSSDTHWLTDFFKHESTVVEFYSNQWMELLSSIRVHSDVLPMIYDLQFSVLPKLQVWCNGLTGPVDKTTEDVGGLKRDMSYWCERMIGQLRMFYTKRGFSSQTIQNFEPYWGSDYGKTIMDYTHAIRQGRGPLLAIQLKGSTCKYEIRNAFVESSMRAARLNNTFLYDTYCLLELSCNIWDCIHLALSTFLNSILAERLVEAPKDKVTTADRIAWAHLFGGHRRMPCFSRLTPYEGNLPHMMLATKDVEAAPASGSVEPVLCPYSTKNTRAEFDMDAFFVTSKMGVISEASGIHIFVKHMLQPLKDTDRRLTTTAVTHLFQLRMPVVGHIFSNIKRELVEAGMDKAKQSNGGAMPLTKVTLQSKLETLLFADSLDQDQLASLDDIKSRTNTTTSSSSSQREEGVTLEAVPLEYDLPFSSPPGVQVDTDVPMSEQQSTDEELGEQMDTTSGGMFSRILTRVGLRKETTPETPAETKEEVDADEDTKQRNKDMQALYNETKEYHKSESPNAVESKVVKPLGVAEILKFCDDAVRKANPNETISFNPNDERLLQIFSKIFTQEDTTAAGRSASQASLGDMGRLLYFILLSKKVVCSATMIARQVVMNYSNGAKNDDEKEPAETLHKRIISITNNINSRMNGVLTLMDTSRYVGNLVKIAEADQGSEMFDALVKVARQNRNQKSEGSLKAAVTELQRSQEEMGTTTRIETSEKRREEAQKAVANVIQAGKWILGSVFMCLEKTLHLMTSLPAFADYIDEQRKATGELKDLSPIRRSTMHISHHFPEQSTGEGNTWWYHIYTSTRTELTYDDAINDNKPHKSLDPEDAITTYHWFSKPALDLVHNYPKAVKAVSTNKQTGKVDNVYWAANMFPGLLLSLLSPNLDLLSNTTLETIGHLELVKHDKEESEVIERAKDVIARLSDNETSKKIAAKVVLPRVTKKIIDQPRFISDTVKKARTHNYSNKYYHRNRLNIMFRQSYMDNEGHATVFGWDPTMLNPQEAGTLAGVGLDPDIMSFNNNGPFRLIAQGVKMISDRYHERNITLATSLYRLQRNVVTAGNIASPRIAGWDRWFSGTFILPTIIDNLTQPWLLEKLLNTGDSPIESVAYSTMKMFYLGGGIQQTTVGELLTSGVWSENSIWKFIEQWEAHPNQGTVGMLYDKVPNLRPFMSTIISLARLTGAFLRPVSNRVRVADISDPNNLTEQRPGQTGLSLAEEPRIPDVDNANVDVSQFTPEAIRADYELEFKVKEANLLVGLANVSGLLSSTWSLMHQGNSILGQASILWNMDKQEKAEEAAKKTEPVEPANTLFIAAVGEVKIEEYLRMPRSRRSVYCAMRTEAAASIFSATYGFLVKGSEWLIAGWELAGTVATIVKVVSLVSVTLVSVMAYKSSKFGLGVSKYPKDASVWGMLWSELKKPIIYMALFSVAIGLAGFVLSPVWTAALAGLQGLAGAVSDLQATASSLKQQVANLGKETITTVASLPQATAEYLGFSITPQSPVIRQTSHKSDGVFPNARILPTPEQFITQSENYRVFIYRSNAYFYTSAVIDGAQAILLSDVALERMGDGYRRNIGWVILALRAAKFGANIYRLAPLYSFLFSFSAGTAAAPFLPLIGFLVLLGVIYKVVKIFKPGTTNTNQMDMEPIDG